MPGAIEFDNVSKSFRRERRRSRDFQQAFIQLFNPKRPRPESKDLFWALRNTTFTIERGETVGLIGSNGAGKSTALKLVSRIIQPSSGQVRVNGRVTALLELGAGFHPELNGRDNILLNGTVMGLTRKQISSRMDQIIEFADIGDYIDEPVKDYSSGMQARLGFAVAAHLDPEIVLVDEALAVGDQAFQQKCNERMLEMRRSGITTVYVSHSLDSIQQICSRAVWLDHGQVRMVDKAHKVANAYYRWSLEQQEDDAPAGSSDKRPGSGEARVTRVELLDNNGRATDIFPTGEALTVRMHYRAESRIERPAVGIGVFHRLAGTHIAGPNNTMSNFVIPELVGEGAVDYRIDALPLLPGPFSLATAIFDWDVVHCYDYWQNAAEFDVVEGATAERHGLITLGGQWSWNAGQHGAQA